MPWTYQINGFGFAARAVIGRSRAQIPPSKETGDPLHKRVWVLLVHRNPGNVEMVGSRPRGPRCFSWSRRRCTLFRDAVVVGLARIVGKPFRTDTRNVRTGLPVSSSRVVLLFPESRPPARTVGARQAQDA